MSQNQKEMRRKLKNMLNEFMGGQLDVKGQIVIAYPAGVPLGSSWKEEIDPILISALSTSIKLTFQYLCKNLEKGNLKRLIVNSEYGRVMIQNAGPNAILNTIMDRDADVSRLAFTVSGFANKIEKYIGDHKY